MSSLKLYKSYNFVDKDPVIDRVRVILSNEGVDYAEASRRSGVAYTTFRNWFEGKTRRPQYATVMAIVRALGYKDVFVKKGGKDGAREVGKGAGNKVLGLRRETQSSERRESRKSA